MFSWRTAAPAAGLFGLNAWLCRELFVTEYTHHLGSIEGAYFGISRYMMEHAGDLTWFPLWYGGIPFQNSYPPLLHALVALVAAVSGVSTALAHHVAVAALFCLGPVALYLLAHALTRNSVAALAAALLYSVISPSAFLMTSVADDIESVWRLRRLQTLVQYGDGPHIAALALMPLAVLAVHAALTRGGVWRAGLAVLSVAAVALTNWLGTFALALAIASYLLARLEEPGRLRLLAGAAGIAVLAYALAAPWMLPTTIGDIRRNAQIIGGSYPLSWGHLKYAAALAVALLVLRWVLAKGQAPIGARFAGYFLLSTAAVVLSAEWFAIFLTPQPERYHLEMEAAICLTAGLLLAGLRGRRTRAVIAVALAVLVAVQMRTNRQYARDLIVPVNIRETVEYKVARWLDENLPGERIYAIGSVQFWLNAFSDTPQIGGGFGQGVSNPQIPTVHFGLSFTERDGERGAMWLRLFGAGAVVVSGPAGRDAYRHGWRDPAKFDGVLPEIWRDGDDVVYRVPRRPASLAHAIRPEHVVRRSPVNIADVEPVLPLATALEDESLPVAHFEWRKSHEAVIRADLAPEQLLFAQISFHPGWSATANGKPVRISADGLGLMIIEPDCAGACEVRLIYDGGWEAVLARWACLLVFGGFAVSVLCQRIVVRRSFTKPSR